MRPINSEIFSSVTSASDDTLVDIRAISQKDPTTRIERRFEGSGIRKSRGKGMKKRKSRQKTGEKTIRGRMMTAGVS